MDICSNHNLIHRGNAPEAKEDIEREKEGKLNTEKLKENEISDKYKDRFN